VEGPRSREKPRGLAPWVRSTFERNPSRIGDRDADRLHKRAARTRHDLSLLRCDASVDEACDHGAIESMGEDEQLLREAMPKAHRLLMYQQTPRSQTTALTSCTVSGSGVPSANAARFHAAMIQAPSCALTMLSGGKARGLSRVAG
jgi:hypothetical protein